MALQLTGAALLELEHLSRLLLSPLAAASLAAWRADVARGLRALLHADRCLFWLPVGDSGWHGEGVEAQTLAGFRHYVEAPMVQGAPSPDPLVGRFLAQRRLQGLDVYDHGTVDRVLGGALRTSVFHNEVERRGGLGDMLALNAPLRGAGGAADVLLAAYHARPGRRRFGEASLPLLRLLLPAYQAGLDAAARLEAHRGALDAVAHAAAVLAPDGRELHRTPALAALLTGTPAEAPVREALQRLARALLPPRATGGLPAAVREVAVAGRALRLRGSVVAAGVFAAGPCVLVSVEALGPPPLPSPAALQARFGLTPREAQVALLLAEGLSNAQLAARLHVSASTARTHVERVLSKAGLRSRKALGLRLLDARGGGPG